MRAEDGTSKTRGNGAVVSGRLEAELWKTADALRGSMDAAIETNLKTLGYTINE